MEVKTSVRNLVEFLFRSGSIDNSIGYGSDESMALGSKIHRMIQQSMGTNYAPEVLLKFVYETPRYNIVIEGRADGIIQEKWLESPGYYLKNKDEELNQELTESSFDQITIDEIKTTAKSLDYLKEPVLVHLAQAKVYAFIYAHQKNLPMIRVRMTYVHSESLEKKYFFEDYTLQSLEKWFSELIENYKRWADFEISWKEKRQLAIKALEFPFPYREGQRELAISAYQTIKEKKKLYLEAPTGVGKTISTVFPTVKAMGEGLVDKIFYLTAKTITRTVAEDTFHILRKNGLSFKTVTITAKEKICPMDKTDCNPDFCPYANGHFDRINDTIYEIITNEDSIDRSVIERYAAKNIVCPFELSLDLSLFSDAIICDYNYVFDPHASLKRYFAGDAKGDYAFLVDEAHNLVDRGREMFSAVLWKEDFLELKRDLKEALETQAKTKIFAKPSLVLRITKALDRCNKELLALKKDCRNCVILEEIDHFASLLNSLNTAVDLYLSEDKSPSEIRKKVMDFYFEVSHFLMIYERLNEHYTIYAELTDNDGFYVKLLCVNPRTNLQEVMKKGRSTILFSATFLPIQYYKKLLGGDPEDYEIYAKSTFNPENRLLVVGRDVTSKYSRRNELEYHRIASYIYEIVNAKAGNYIVFFPSYAFMTQVFDAYETSFYDKEQETLIVQQEKMSEEDREYFLRYFDRKNHIIMDGTTLPDMQKPPIVGVKDTLVAFCVLGGIFSEGIDLKEDELIGAIIVGTGLPLKCNEREILKDHFDEEGENGFQYAYQYPGMNKVLQAAGRVIRTAKDIGVVALLDERFLERQNLRLFPREWENFQVVSSATIADTVEEFWLSKEDIKRLES